VNVLLPGHDLLRQTLPTLVEALQLCLLSRPKLFLFVSSLSVFTSYVSSDLQNNPGVVSLTEDMTVDSFYNCSPNVPRLVKTHQEENKVIGGYAISKIVLEYIVDKAARQTGVEVGKPLKFRPGPY